MEPHPTPPLIVGEHPLARDAQGNLKSRIGTLFLRGNVLLTIPGVHATQRLAYSERLNEQRRAAGQPPLTGAEEMAEWNQSVDLIMEGDVILIRPDPQNMAAAFVGDELLQRLVSKQQIRFLNAMDEHVRQAIKERGECWRISALPQSPAEMERMIRGSRIAIGQQAIYYYSAVTGTRYLTYHDFVALGALPPAALTQQLHEIREYSGRHNRFGHPEVDFFGANDAFSHAALAAINFLQADPAQLAKVFADLQVRFCQAVPAELRDDDLANLAWRNRMFSALIGQQNQTVADDILHGLSPEFFMQIQWLPGGRIADGEFIFDPIFDELEQRPDDTELAALCDQKAKGFIFNFIREFGDVEYLNVGRVASSLSHRPHGGGQRGVYIAEIKQQGMLESVARVIRLQKWNILDHLAAGKTLLDAIQQAEEYTEYILDRRLGCRQLGMNLPTSITTRRIYQPYHGPRHEYAGQMIWFTYFERDYINGVATDKLAAPQFRSPAFASTFARLLGQAAAASLIVGKADQNNRALFDDGDEVLIQNNQGQPIAIVTSDHTGTFVNYTTSLAEAAADYARPVNRRLTLVPDPAAFAAAYIQAFVEQVRTIQHKYRSMQRGFDALFKHRQRDEKGSFAYRWEKVLERLNHADALVLGERIRGNLAGGLSSTVGASATGTGPLRKIECS